MILRILSSTDGKFLGMTFDDEQPLNLNQPKLRILAMV